VKDDILIRDNYKCCFCGVKNNLNIDHKDDTYNVSGKLTAEHGQVVCGHHNFVKRGGNPSKRNERRPPPCLKPLIKYTNNSVDYWKDPCKWVNSVKDWFDKTIDKLEKKLKDKDATIEKLSKKLTT
jgi:hypothetical protein